MSLLTSCKADSSGPQTFRASQAPSYNGGVAAMLIGYCIGIVVSQNSGCSSPQLIFGYFLNIVRLNRRNARWREEHPETEEAEPSEWLDQTDFEQKGFRYVQ